MEAIVLHIYKAEKPDNPGGFEYTTCYTINGVTISSTEKKSSSLGAAAEYSLEALTHKIRHHAGRVDHP